MALIVQKFGGSSVKDRDRIFNVARIVANTHNAGNDVEMCIRDRDYMLEYEQCRKEYLVPLEEMEA